MSEPVDILIKHAYWLITVDPERRIITDGAIAIKGDKIVEVGKTADLEPKYVADRVIDATDKVIVPGLIDSHLHSSFQLSRGLADEAGARRFLFERMYPYEGLLEVDDNYWSAALCALESLRHGVTTFIDPGNYAPAETAKVVGESGMRAIVAKSAMDVSKSALGGLPETFIETMDEALTRSQKVVEELHGLHDGRVRAWFSFRGVNNCSDDFIKQMKQLADQYGVGLQAHACFAKETREASSAQYNIPELERLNRLGVLDKNLLLIHMGWVTPNEFPMVVEHDLKIVVAASSSLHNGYGNILMGKAPEYLELGVAVGLGSDHASSGIVDLPTEMFLAAGGYKEVRLDAEVMPPERVLEMATINGARCALWEDEIGSIEAGKKADITIFDTRRPEWQPLYNPLANLVYSANGSSVDTVICNGKVLVEGGEVKTLDQERIFHEVRKRAPEILERTGLEEIIKPTWPIH